jgi:Domain of unknown function (DU1801)
MISKALSAEKYLLELPEDRIAAMEKLRALCIKNIKGAEEVMAYGMISYVVPLSNFPKGYHCTPGKALPFISIASQKNYIAIHHLGMYANKPLLDWFTEEYPKHSTAKIDIGKGCIKFKKIDQIPFEFLSTFLNKMSLKEWIIIYTAQLDKR